MLHLSAKYSRSLIWWEDPIWETFWEPLIGPIIPFGSLVEYYPISAKDQSRMHQIGKKILPGLFLGCALYAGEIGRVTFGLRTLRSWKRWTHLKSTRKDSMRKRWLFPKEEGKFIFQSQMDESNPWRRSGIENIHLDTAATNSRRRSRRFSWRIRRVSSTTSWLISGCRWSDKWLLVMSGNFIYRHHVEPRVKLYSPREESFPIPLKYFDVSRTTHTKFDVKQERRIDDYWNIDGSRDLSDSWTGFIQFTLLEEKPPNGYMWSGGRLTRRQLTSRPDHLWPELWTKLGRNAQLKERQKWSHEKPKLDNARKLRGIYFIDPEDREFKETIKNARKKLETSMAPAMPCKTSKKSKKGETRSKTNDFKSKFACILDASESTRMRTEESQPKYHEGHIAGKGDKSLQHYNLVHKFLPMHQAMKIPASTAAVDKELEKLEKIPAWNLTRVRSEKEVIDEAMTKGAKFHSASLMDTCHLTKAELETKHQKNTKVELYSDDSGSHAVFTEQGSSASRMTAAKVMDIISRLPGCAGQAADAVSAET